MTSIRTGVGTYGAQEAVHLRRHSSRNLLQSLHVARTGSRNGERGEGIYVGSAESNWCELTDCEPDRSDGNQVIDSHVEGTTAEAIDIKEGTTGGVLRGKSLDGSAAIAADSLIDVKGNDWAITDTEGAAAPELDAAVFQILPGWGEGNRFTGNKFKVPASGWAVRVFGHARSGRNVVECSNVAVVGGVEAPRGYLRRDAPTDPVRAAGGRLAS